jgi:hypothetical protein
MRFRAALAFATLALIAAAVGAFYYWQSLVAAGVATVILGVLPCLAMCALGLCMGRMAKQDTAALTSASLPADGEESARQPESKVER